MDLESSVSLSRPSTSLSSQTNGRPKTGHAHRNDLMRSQMERPYSRTTAINEPAVIPSSRPVSGRSGLIPGTASRLIASSMNNRPVSRSGTLGQSVQVQDRPVTQQMGLSGLKTPLATSMGTAGGRRGRVYQDKSYFMGILRTKMADLDSEVRKMELETQEAQEEQATYLAYDTKVKELAKELTEAQGKLSDLNFVVDKLNTDADLSSVRTSINEMKTSNELDVKKVEELFDQRRLKEEQVGQVEQEIEQQRRMAENLIEAMQPELKERYIALQESNKSYQSSMEEMNRRMEQLSVEKNNLDNELANSNMKKEAIGLYEQLLDAEQRVKQLKDEEEQRGTPAQERERLLIQVKNDNADMATMERKIAQLQDQLKNLRGEEEQLESDLEEQQSERSQKYRELRQRETTMDAFLSDFEGSMSSELERITSLEQQIEIRAEDMSRQLGLARHLPSQSAFMALQSELGFKEEEVGKSRNTIEALNEERNLLKVNLEKIERLEEKIHLEMDTLKSKVRSMEQEMSVFVDLDKVRSDAELKKSMIDRLQSELSKRREGVNTQLKEVNEHYEKLKRDLTENETHVQLTNLEKKLSHLEQNNFALDEFVATKRAELNFEPIRNKVLRMQNDYNKIVVDALTK